MANICSLEEIIESFDVFQSTNNIFVDEYCNDLRGKLKSLLPRVIMARLANVIWYLIVIRYILWNNIIRIKTWYLQRNKTKFLIK